MFTFLSSPGFWSHLFTFLVALYFSFLAGRAMLRCEQLARRVQVLEDFNGDVVEQVELQLTAKGLRPINGDLEAKKKNLEDICGGLIDELGVLVDSRQRAHASVITTAHKRMRAMQQARAKSEDQASLESICKDIEDYGEVRPINAEFERRKAVVERMLKDLVHSEAEFDKAFNHLIENGAATDVQVELAEARQTIGSMVFGLLALHHVVTQFMSEFSFMRDNGASGLLKFPGFGEHFRVAREAEDAKRT